MRAVAKITAAQVGITYATAATSLPPTATNYSAQQFNSVGFDHRPQTVDCEMSSQTNK